MNGYTPFSYQTITNMKNKKGQRLFSFLKGITCFLFLSQTGIGWAQKDSLYYDEASDCSWEFLIYDDHVEATGLKWKKNMEAKLPAYIDGKPVTVIGSGFFGGFAGALTSYPFHGTFIVPTTVEEIGDQAFASVAGLEIVLESPSSLKKIGKEAFWYCEYLTRMSLPESVEEIGEGCFASCYDLRFVTLPSALKEIPKRAFEGCSDLEDFQIPQSVESIGERAFYGAQKLKTTLPPNLKEIGAYAFYIGAPSKYEYNLTKMNGKMPETLETIGDYAFVGFKMPSTIDIPDGVSTINNGIFQYCEDIEKITLPEAIGRIGANAFDGCVSLESVNIPSNTNYIGNSAFANTALEKAGLPASVTFIGTGVFNGCEKLSSATLPDLLTSIPANMFAGCTSLASIEIPNTVTSIGNYAFQYCPLESVSLPDSLRTIGDDAFKGARLRSIVIPPLVTSIGKGALECASYGSYPDFTTYLDYIILETKQYVSLEKAIGQDYIYETLYPLHLIVPSNLKQEYETVTYKIVRGDITGYDPKGVNEIASNQYYTFRNRSTGQYLQLSANGEDETALVTEVDMRCSAGAQIRLIESGTANKYYMAVQNVSEPMLGTLNFKGEDAPIEHPAFWRWNLMVDGQYLAVDDKGNFVKTDKADDNADWYIAPTTEFDVKMKNGEDGQSYATLYLPFDVQASGSSKMYVATGSDDKTVKLTEVADGKLKSGNGALIMNSEGADVVTLQITSRAQKPSVNLFEGSYKDQYQASAENEYYVLDFTTENGIGFYPPETPVLKANEAYLPYNDANQNAVFLSLDFENSGSGIHSTTTDAAPTSKGQMFDLQGRRIMHRPQKGIYIMDGRKYVVK